MQRIQLELIVPEGRFLPPSLALVDFSAQLHFEFLRMEGVRVLDRDPARLVIACGKHQLVIRGWTSLKPIALSIRFFLSPEQVLREIPLGQAVREGILNEVESGMGRAKYGYLLGAGLGSSADFLEARELSLRELIQSVRLVAFSGGLTLTEILAHARFVT